ncbi:MAG: zinc-binding dehydrogenase [Promethearchaeati archaeon SRVP18_Atabeyarchaeia-1]
MSSRGKMKAAMYYGPNIMKYEETEIPEIGNGDILVKVQVALTCGTDLKTFKRGHPVVVQKLPMVLGHEFAGTVEKVGSNVKVFRKGMRVVAANSAPCNTCFYCKRGRQNICEHLNENIISGAYAEYIRVPEHIVRQNTYEIPASLSYRDAALLEPLACVVHGASVAGINLGDTVTIIGSGPIGLLMLQLVKRSGTCRAIVSDLSAKRLESAKVLGADFIINAEKEDQIAKVKELTEGRGADVVIEAVGQPKTWEAAIEMTRKAGTCVLFGGAPAGTTFSIDTRRFHYEELTIKGVFHHTPLYVEKAFKLLACGAINTNAIITHQMPLKNVVDALKLMETGEANKVAITPF